MFTVKGHIFHLVVLPEIVMQKCQRIMVQDDADVIERNYMEKVNVLFKIGMRFSA